jgi:predicted transposase YdaD
LIRNPTEREEVKGMFQSYADVMLEEGMRKGKLEGKLEGETEGRAIEARKIILRLGTQKLGAPKSAEITALAAIADVDRLGRMSDRLLSVSSWADLLATP